MSIDNESPILPDPKDQSLQFKVPLKILYYALKSCTFEQDEDSGCTMPCEDYEIKEMYIGTNEELLRLHEKVMNEEINLPIPWELQLMFSFMQTCGGYKARVSKHKHE